LSTGNSIKARTWLHQGETTQWLDNRIWACWTVFLDFVWVVYCGDWRARESCPNTKSLVCIALPGAEGLVSFNSDDNNSIESRLKPKR
jgi:hypothetical protein